MRLNLSVRIKNYHLALMALAVFIFTAAAFCKAPHPAVAIWETLVKTDSVTGKAPAEVKKMMDQKVSVVGFMIINEFENGKVSEFLLARYPAGCIHVPLPPANTIIHVKMKNEKGVFPGGEVIVNGVIKLGGRVDAIYEMMADTVEEYKGN